MADVIRRAQQFENALKHVYQRKKIAGKLQPFIPASRFIAADVQLINPTQLADALKLSDNLALYAGASNVMAERAGGFVRYSFELERPLWTHYTRADVAGMEFGVAAGNKRVVFDFSDYHHLFAGSTKSGKSTTMASVLYALAMENHPQDLGIYIVDPHNDYVSFDGLAHLEMARATSYQEIEAVYATVSNLLQRRKNNNERDGKRIVLLTDECQDSVNLGDSISGFNDMQSGVFSQLAQGAGKYRIHLIAGSQKPTQADLPGIHNLLGRYVGKVDKAATGAHLTGRSGVEAHKLSGEGDFVKITSSGHTRFVSARVTQEQYGNLPRADVVSIPAEVQLLDCTPALEKSIGRPQECLDFEQFGVLVGMKMPGRVNAEKYAGVSQHMHRRYKEAFDLFLTGLRRGIVIKNTHGI